MELSDQLYAWDYVQELNTSITSAHAICAVKSFHIVKNVLQPHNVVSAMQEDLFCQQIERLAPVQMKDMCSMPALVVASLVLLSAILAISMEIASHAQVSENLIQQLQDVSAC